jgi:hypothetical protein
MSDEHFYKHWATVHADLTVASKAFNVYKIERYTQVGMTTLESNCCCNGSAS